MGEIEMLSCLHLFCISGSVFKSGWMDSPPEWFQPNLASDFELLHSIKDVSNKVLENARIDGIIGSSLEAELIIKTKSQYLTNILSRHLPETGDVTPSESVEFSLADLLIVSKAELTGDEVSDQENRHSVCEEVDCCGEKVEVQAFVTPVSKSGRYKCPRCWKLTSLSGLAVCSRCDTVLSSYNNSL